MAHEGVYVGGEYICIVCSIVRNGDCTLYSSCLLSLVAFPVMLYFQDSSTQVLYNECD